MRAYTSAYAGWVVSDWRRDELRTIRGCDTCGSVTKRHISKLVDTTMSDMKVTSIWATSGLLWAASLAIATLVSAQSSTGSSTPQLSPRVQPVLPQQPLPESKDQDNALREKLQLDKARELAQARRDEKLEQETQARGYWVDPSTGLMWAAKDNGEAVAWRGALKYCRKMRLAGYSDWRLATLDELASLGDKRDSERIGNNEIFYINIGRHVRGGLLLKGDPWSSNRPKNRFGHPYGDGWYFDFVNLRPSYDLPYFRNTRFALCVRRSGN